MKRLLYILSALMLFAGCSKDDSRDNFRDDLFLDSEHTVAEGSYVQGATLNDLAKITIPYQNAKGGSAKIWAEVRNGIAVAEQTVTMEQDAGTATVQVSGMPIELTNTFLQLNVAYQGKTYISSVEIPVIMDPDPSGEIDFEIDDTAILSLLEATEIPFRVTPSMASVVIDASQASGLSVRVDQDMQAGTGVITLTPSAEFLSGSIHVSATFGVRPIVSADIAVNGFAAGDGTSQAPYEVSTTAQFMKITSGAALSYKLTDDVSLGSISPFTAFSGVIDGGGKTVEYTLDKPASDNVALFAVLNATASISNLVLKGTVTGQDNVAALAATNNGATLTAVTAPESTVQGRNTVALLSASGTGKDTRVLTFTNVPPSVNITMGTLSATQPLGISPKSADVTFDKGDTKLKSIFYNATTGEATFTLPDNTSDFTPGNVTFTVRLGASGTDANVSSTVRTIGMQSKKMYESGTGEANDPYMVLDGDQLYATMSTYSDKAIELMNDVEIANWTTIPSFSGVFNGAGYKLSKLSKTFTANNSGTIERVKFTDVNIANTATGDFGAVANVTTGTIRKIAVVGSLSSTASGDQRFGAIAGSINAGSINDCYTNVTMTASCTGIGGIAGFFNGTTAEGVKVANCTSEGSITWSNSATRVGGIVGRKNSNTGGKDYILNCLSTMVLSGTSTDTGSNMIGGIFGVSASGMNDNRLYIKECVFRGRVKSVSCGGGIAGLGPDIADCLVIGEGSDAVNSTILTSSSNNGSTGGITAGAKGNITRCIVADAKLTGPATAGGIASAQNNGSPTASSCMVLNTSVSAGAKSVYGAADTKLALNNCFYSGVVYGDGSGSYVPGTPTNDGTAGEAATMTQSWYEGLGYNFTTVWMWDAAKSRPMLKNVGCSADVKP